MQYDLMRSRLRTYLRQVDFMRYELRYTLLRAELSPHDASFHRLLMARINYLLARLTERRNKIQGLLDGTPAGSIEWSKTRIEVEIEISRLAPILDGMTHAIVQRRLKPSRARGSADADHHMPLNECHPAYADFYRGVENTVREAFARLAPCYFGGLRQLPGSPDSLMPLLVVSKEPRFSLVSFGVHESDDPPDDFMEYAKRVFLLSYLTLPRYSPATLWLSPPVAHETAHFLMHMLRFLLVHMRDPKTHSTRDVQPDDQSIEKANRWFGRPNRYVELITSFAKLAESYQAALSDMVKSSLTPSSLRGVLAQHKDDLAACASKQVVEMVCDIFGVVLAGPAFAFSFLQTAFVANPAEFAGRRIKFDHPPALFRISLQMMVLRHLGFADADKLVGQSLQQFRKVISPATWESTQHMLPWLDSVSTVIEKVVADARLWVIPSPAESYGFVADQDRRMDELKWRVALHSLADRVLLGKAQDGFGTDCFDLLNAWWLQMLGNDGRSVGSSLPWMLCLRNRQPQLVWERDSPKLEDNPYA